MYPHQADRRRLGHLVVLPPAHAGLPSAYLLELEWRLFNLRHALDQLMSAGVRFQRDVRAGCACLEARGGCHHRSWAAESHRACHGHLSWTGLRAGRLVLPRFHSAIPPRKPVQGRL